MWSTYAHFIQARKRMNERTSKETEMQFDELFGIRAKCLREGEQTSKFDYVARDGTPQDGVTIESLELRTARNYSPLKEPVLTTDEAVEHLKQQELPEVVRVDSASLTKLAQQNSGCVQVAYSILDKCLEACVESAKKGLYSATVEVDNPDDPLQFSVVRKELTSRDIEYERDILMKSFSDPSKVINRISLHW